MNWCSSTRLNRTSRAPALKALIFPSARRRSRVSVEMPRKCAASSRVSAAFPMMDSGRRGVSGITHLPGLVADLAPHGLGLWVGKGRNGMPNTRIRLKIFVRLETAWVR